LNIECNSLLGKIREKKTKQRKEKISRKKTIVKPKFIKLCMANKA
jgi:hypothetical protein